MKQYDRGEKQLLPINATDKKEKSYKWHGSVWQKRFDLTNYY